MKKKILAWCSSPTIASGFGRQVNLILKSIYKTEQYEIDIVGKDYHGEEHNLPYKILPLFDSKEISKVSPELQQVLLAGHTKCSGIDVVRKNLMTGEYDILFVYQDMYITSPLGQWFGLIKQELARLGGKDFKTICYYTVDGKTYPEFLGLAKEADIIVTPNAFGVQKIREHLNKDIKIIPHGIENVFQELNGFDRASFRKEYFKEFADKFIIGYVGSATNERKNITDALVGFSAFLKHKPDAYLYLHSIVTDKILKCIDELGIEKQVIRLKEFDPRIGLPLIVYRKIIASLDVLLNTSYSEAWGLPITEAMASKVPVLMPENIAMSEEFRDFTWQIKTSDSVICFDATALHKKLDIGSMVSNLIAISEKQNDEKEEKASEYISRYRQDVIGKMWQETFESLVSEHTFPTDKAILFAQYETAGDILLSTQCFKGLKEKHEGCELHYMTHPMYMDILKGNPYIDKLMSWDGNLIKKYKHVYKPHIDKIRTGGWGTGDISLAQLYPDLCEVEADDVYIECIKPGIELPDKYIAVHTTGGHPFRIYKAFDKAFEGIELPIIQIGGRDDFKVNKSIIDLKGKLSFRETAWVIKQAVLFCGVDSFSHHCASALGTKQVVVFSSASPRATASPKTDGVILHPDWLKNCPIISPCHGNYRKCEKPCIDTVDPADVKRAIEQTLVLPEKVIV